MSDMHRRDFIKKTSAAGLGALAASRGIAPLIHTRSPNEKVVMAVIGVNGRGEVHAKNFAGLPTSEVAYICDVDSNVLAKGVKAATSVQSRVPKTIGDFRRALDDKSVDAISIATPDHWHAP